MKNLEIMGVQEMDAAEMKNIEGGSLLVLAIVTLACGVAGYFIAKYLDL